MSSEGISSREPGLLGKRHPAQQQGFESTERPVIYWARRDLRVDDNPALQAALAASSRVIPVFVWAPEEEGQFQPGRYSRWWLKHTVILFAKAIEGLGSQLVVRRATETGKCLVQMVKETGAKAVYFNHLYDPISLMRDHEVKGEMQKAGIECRSFNADLLYEPWEVMDERGQPLTSFESFWNRVLSMPYPPPFPLPPPSVLPPVDPSLHSLEVAGLDWFFTAEQEASSEQLRFKWKPGVEGALEQLDLFLSGRLPMFEHDRAKVDRNSTSALSPWIHTGTISVRYIFYRVCQKQAELNAAAVESAKAVAAGAPLGATELNNLRVGRGGGGGGGEGGGGSSNNSNQCEGSKGSDPMNNNNEHNSGQNNAVFSSNSRGSAMEAQLRHAKQDITQSCRDFLQQLGYREYSRYLSFHFPFIHERALMAHLRACPWRLDQGAFKAWRQGQTGYPLVDAAMRELWSTGWCHNRMRVVAASFMVKNLLLPWQWGLKHFWDAQMDADLECDALGWQYVSGGMTDAHPFDYMLDLDKEAARFDPDGEYVRRWLPVLSRLPTQYIHKPWLAPHTVLAAADVELGYNYPERIITADDSARNMVNAIRVLDKAADASMSMRSGPHPYRPPTMETFNSSGRPSGAGTGTAFPGLGGRLAPTGGAGEMDGAPTPGADVAEAREQVEQGRSDLQHDQEHQKAEGAQPYDWGIKGWRAGKRAHEVILVPGGAASAGASRHAVPRRSRRDDPNAAMAAAAAAARAARGQRRLEQGVVPCAPEAGDEAQESGEEVGAQECHGPECGRRMFWAADAAHPGLSSCSGSESGSMGAESEEVVSNTVMEDLRKPALSGWSARWGPAGGRGASGAVAPAAAEEVGEVEMHEQQAADMQE